MIRNYRYKHYIIIAFLVTVLIVSMLPVNTPRYVGNIISLIYILVIGWLGIGEKTEKPDELTKLNISKANKYTMYAALLAILVFAFFSDPDNAKDLVTLPSIVYNITFCGLIIFRSLVFLVLDKKDLISEDDQ